MYLLCNPAYLGFFSRAGKLRCEVAQVDLSQRRLDPLRGQRGAAQADAGRVEDGVGEGGGDRADRAFARAGGREFGVVGGIG